MRLASLGFVVLVAVCFVSVPSRADDSFNDLMIRVPESANALVLLDLEGVKNSPIGKSENWAHKHESEYLAGTTGISPKLLKLVLAAELDPGTLRNNWEIAIGARSDKVSMEKLAKAQSGSLDKIGGQAVVFTPRNAAFVELGPNTLGVMRPANRQALARWLRTTKTNNKNAVSPYLMAAADKVKDTAKIVMALDMADMLDEEGVTHRLNESKTLGAAKGDIAEETKVIASLRGLTLTIDFTGTINGQLKIEFGEDVKPIKFLAKKLVYEALDGVGAHVEDMDDWYAEAEGKAITMRGKFSPKGLRQVLSFITPPTDAIETAKISGSDSEAIQDPKVLASQRYYMAITSYLSDLREQKANTFKSLALWYDKYSQKIDNLPLLDVDEELLKYGSNVSNTLRAIAQSARGVPIQQSVLKQQEAHVQAGGYVPYGYGYANPWGYGYGTAWGYQYLDVNNYKQVQNLQKNVNSGEYEARMQAWRMIDEQTAAIRKTLVQKYKTDFKTGGAQLKTETKDR